MRVAIAGGGVAGLATAIVMSRRGHTVEVFEHQPQDRASGMGFIVTDEAWENLAYLGVSSRLAGVALNGYWRYDRAGELRQRHPLPDRACGVNRADLVAALTAAAPSGVVRHGCAVESVLTGADGAVHGFALADGRRTTADFYVGADGVRSVCRHALFSQCHRSTARVWELVGQARRACWGGQGFHKFIGDGVAFGLLPVDRDSVVWFIQFDTERIEPPTESPIDRRRFVLAGGWPSRVLKMVERSDFSRVHLWRPVDADPLPCLHGPNMVLVGDAAHPLLPFTSQGVASALADAVDLGLALDLARSLPDALASYTKVSIARCAPLVAAGRSLAHDFLNGGCTETPIAT